MKNFEFLLLFVFVVQNSATALVGKHTRSSVSEEDAYQLHNMLLTAEILKFSLSLVLEGYNTNGKLLNSLHEHVLSKPLDTLKVSIPALLFYCQNYAYYAALLFISAPLVQVTSQCKMITTALLSVVVLDRHFSNKQWICIFIVALGVAIVVSSGDGNNDNDNNNNSNQAAVATGAAAVSATTMTSSTSSSIAIGQQNNATLLRPFFVVTTTFPSPVTVMGLMCVGVACVCSSLGGVYFEKVLKNIAAKEKVSMWIRNVQLSFFSIVLALLQGASSASGKTMFHGFTGWVWLNAVLLGVGGLLVAGCLKYTSSVTKGLATGISVVVSTLGSNLLWNAPRLTFSFVVGAFLIVASAFSFNNPLQFPKLSTTRKAWLLLCVALIQAVVVVQFGLMQSSSLSLFDGLSLDSILQSPLPASDVRVSTRNVLKATQPV